MFIKERGERLALWVCLLWPHIKSAGADDSGVQWSPASQSVSAPNRSWLEEGSRWLRILDVMVVVDCGKVSQNIGSRSWTRCLTEKSLSEKSQSALLARVRLSKHRGSRLDQDVVSGERGRFSGDICISDTAIRGFEIDLVRGEGL